MDKPSVSLDQLQDEAEKLLALLKDRQTGMMSWHFCLNERLKGFYSLIAPLYQTAVLPVAVEKFSTIFHIDRSTPFNPVSLLGSGASFWRGPRGGNGRRGKLEQDARSLALTEIDLATIQFKSYLPDGQTLITGEDRILAVKAVRNDIPLDAQTGLSLYGEEGQKSLRYLYDTKGITWFECLGQTLRDASGLRYSLVLYRLVGGSWSRRCSYLGRDRRASDPAAVVCK